MTAPLTPDLCVIGAGAGGLAVAAGAVQIGANVVLIECGEMGGDCLNYGCIPSKSLLVASHLAERWRRAPEMGLVYQAPRVDFAAVQTGVRRVIARIAPNDSAARFEGLGVTVIRAPARFADSRTVRAGDTMIRARRFVVATGSKPAIPPIPGLDGVPYFTNETIFANEVLPRHLLVIGGGPVGLELAQAHRGLGSAVTVVDSGPILPHDDSEAVEVLTTHLADSGITLRASTGVRLLSQEPGGIVATLTDGERVTASHLLVATGRTPNITEIGLEAAGIATTTATARAGITVGRHLRTSNRRVYAIGDAAGGPQFTHVALYHAGIVIRNALFRLPASVDYRALPWVTYTDPELAQVGLTEAAARQQGRVRVVRWSFAENDRAQTERDTGGFVKAVLAKNGRILGATIVGAGAGEMIAMWALAVSQTLKIGAIANLMLPYPTRSEASRRAAGAFYTPTLFSPRTRRLVRLLAKFG